MTAPFEQALAYHLGFAVRDREEAIERFGRSLGVTQWYRWELDRPDILLRVTYGRSPWLPLAVELVEPARGETLLSRFLAERGEGLQHMGVWVPDVVAAVADAVQRGATVRSLVQPEPETGTVTVTLDGGTEALVPAWLQATGAGFLDAGLSGLQLEILGPAALDRLQANVGDAVPELVPLPPWAAARFPAIRPGQ